jgi:hypothetical protein
MFLGIDMGHLQDQRQILDAEEWRRGNRVAIDEWVVETNTGMSCVIPAWKVRELLYIDELVESRQTILEQSNQKK